MRKFIFLLLTLPLPAFATSYFVTQSGAGTGAGTALANAWSLANYESSSAPTGGDTVTFSGTFTSTVTIATSGTGNGAQRLTLNFAAATITTANTRLQINSQAYLNLMGGTLGYVSGQTADVVDWGGNASAPCHDIDFNGWTYTGNTNDVSQFSWIDYVYNLTFENCHVTNCGGFLAGDSSINHDIDIKNNYVTTSIIPGNAAKSSPVQVDVIRIGDCSNMTIEGNYLQNNAQSSNTNAHNDVIQTYEKGGSNAASPTNWIVRYNWIECHDTNNGSGDNSWMMIENMDGAPALTVYGNVFYSSTATTDANNGICMDSENGGSYYFYNNTIIRNPWPDNTWRTIDGPGTLYAENNVGYAAASSNGTFLVWQFTTGKYDYNFFYQFQDATKAEAGTHGSITTNPGFNNSAGNDFSLVATSPLKGTGDATIGAAYNQGLAPGATWPNPVLVTRTSWDVGAYQSSISPLQVQDFRQTSTQ